MIGRRLPVAYHPGTLFLANPDEMPWPEQPGDYCGPVMGFTGDKPAVFFLKPNARDAGAPPRARSVQHVVSPPHVFTEEADGTLTIRASISDLAGSVSESDGWHGFLERGVWRKA